MTLQRDDGTAAAGGMLAAAVTLAKDGMPVFPLHSIRDGACSCGNAACENVAKHPRTAHGFQDATTDLDVVLGWWQATPDANIGVPTGPASGYDVLDVDPRHGGAASLSTLERKHGRLPQTAETLTGSGGRHIWFAHADGVRNSTGQLGAGLDVRGDGGYVVMPPSVHESTRPYRWTRPLVNGAVAWPAWLLADTAKQRNGAAPAIADAIPEGERDTTLASLAGSMRRRGMTAAEITTALSAVNTARCLPPLPGAQVERIAESVSRYAPEDAPREPVPPREPYHGDPLALADVHATFTRHLYLPDPGGLYVVLAAVAANLGDGDPVWLLDVAASGGGKTELLNALGGLEGVHAAATLTEASLLSGTSKRETASDARGGLLRTIGEQGILTLKDFGSVLSMNRDARAALLAALREIYDGSWTRHVGTDGGRTLHWSGKLGLIAGCTPAIDQHHAVTAALGERFIMFRPKVGDTSEQARRSLANSSNTRQMRRELRDAVTGLFAGIDVPTPVRFADSDIERLVALSVLVVRCRSAVIRDGYSREIEFVPDAEAPGRLVAVLGRLLSSLRLIGVPDVEAWYYTTRAALDSMPALRRQALDLLLDSSGQASTTEIAALLEMPTSTMRRVLQDMTAHGIVTRHPGERGKSDRWSLTDWARNQHRTATVPERSKEV